MKKPHQDFTSRGIIRFNLLTSLLSILNKNDENDTDFIIARYFLDHLNDLKQSSIYKIADECFVSRSSIQRFIKTIGFDSFTQLKDDLDEVLDHEKAFINYTDHVLYAQRLANGINDMIQDFSKASHTSNFHQLVSDFLLCKNVVILTAEDSVAPCRLFQQQILSIGKLIRILSSANKNLSLLEQLNEDDLLMVCSVTGNFALAVNDNVQPIKAKKWLITLNTTTQFDNTYDARYFLGKQIEYNNRTITSSRNLYNNYGLTFFFDLFYHECYIRRDEI